jgi:hypothetical protein
MTTRTRIQLLLMVPKTNLLVFGPSSLSFGIWHVPCSWFSLSP